MPNNATQIARQSSARVERTKSAKSRFRAGVNRARNTVYKYSPATPGIRANQNIFFSLQSSGSRNNASACLSSAQPCSVTERRKSSKTGRAMLRCKNTESAYDAAATVKDFTSMPGHMKPNTGKARNVSSGCLQEVKGGRRDDGYSTA